MVLSQLLVFLCITFDASQLQLDLAFDQLQL
jgi:hypothetical protein